MPNVVLVDPGGSLAAEHDILEEVGLEVMYLASIDALRSIPRLPEQRVGIIDLDVFESNRWTMDDFIFRLHLSVLMLTNSPNLDAVVAAMRAGASDILQRPVAPQMLRTSIAQIAPSRGLRVARFRPVDHAAERLARTLIPVIESETDICTLEEWGRLAAASGGTIRNWCLTAHVRPRRLLLFGRLLRVALLMPTEPLERALRVSDLRTLRGLLKTAGFDQSGLPASVEDYCLRQQLVADPAIIDYVMDFVRKRVRERIA